MAKIFVIEDDLDLLDLLELALRKQGHQVQVSCGGADALNMLRAYKFDLIILDWMMPELSGIEICKQFRNMGGKTPILMLTAKASVDEKEKGLDSGVDDYLTKPFDNKELFARIRALLRRPGDITDTVLEFSGVSLDPISCEVKVKGKSVHLRPKVYDMLEFFMRHPDQVFSADAILQRVWLDDNTSTPDTVRTHIKHLRRSINTPGLIENVRGKGYYLKSKEKK